MVEPPKKQVGYVAYIDEAGDDGLKRIRSIDGKGATEWFAMAAVVIKAERVPQVPQWTRGIIDRLGLSQRTELHFTDLAEHNQALTCQAIADSPLRCFVVASNKRNMRGYQNANAAKMGGQAFFYCWMTRLLLERVTEFCERRLRQDYNDARIVRVEIAERAGVRYSQLGAYLKRLEWQSRAKTLYLTHRDLRWSVFDVDQMRPYQYRERAGFQLADTVASAFYKAAENASGGPGDMRCAKILAPRMARDRYGRVYDCGVTLFPTIWQANLAPSQRRIFDFYRDLSRGRNT